METALAVALGTTIEANELRALCAAWADWETGFEEDFDVAGEGLRALPDDEREVAFRFFDDSSLMCRFSELVMGNPEIWDAVEELDPVNGPALDAMRSCGNHQPDSWDDVRA